MSLEPTPTRSHQYIKLKTGFCGRFITSQMSNNFRENHTFTEACNKRHGGPKMTW